MTRTEREIILAGTIIIICLAGAIGAYLYFKGQQPITHRFGGEYSQSAETPYGENLEINLNVGGETSSESSWLASYSDSASQQVYTVDGTYASQEQVTLGYSASISYSNVENIKITVKIKAIDSDDSSYYEYVLANAKSLSGSSPISDSGSTQASISQHLSDCDASTSDATIYYQVYAKVTGTGTISGATLTAEIPYTQFASKHYVQSTESTSADVSPTVSVASWTETLQQPEMLVIIALAVLALIIAVAPRKAVRRRRK